MDMSIMHQEMQNLQIRKKNGNRYWLASRGVCAYAMDRCAYFGPGYVRESVVDSYSYLFNSSGDETVSEFSLRAVVTLRADIPGVVE